MTGDRADAGAGGLRRKKDTRDIIVPEAIIRDIARSEEDFCRRIRKCDPLAGARHIATGYRANFERIQELLGEHRLASAKILEIGSGNGFLLCYALTKGIDMVGVEPGKGFGFQGRFSTAVKLLGLNGFREPKGVLVDATAESLPFEDNSFDLVFSIAVMEHVKNVDQVMRESLRVLKPGGILWANVPNYHSWHEGHYDIFWLPFLGKRGGKIYVKYLYGRDPSFIDTLNFTAPADFRRYLDSRGSQGALYLRGTGLCAQVFEAHHLVRKSRETAITPQGGRLKRLLVTLSASKASFIVQGLLRLLSGALGFAGMAPVFDVILYKRTDT